MDLDELLEFIASENRRLHEYHSELTDETAVLSQTVKLNEEIGELCDSVLAFHSLQRDEKLETFEEEDIGDEVADVLITALLLADTMEIDVENALENKVRAVENRYE